MHVGWFQNHFREKIKDSKKIYIERGYSRITNVFDKKEVLQIRTASYELLKNIEKANPRLQKTPRGNPALVFWPQDICPIMKNFAHDDRMKEIVRYYLGDKVFQLNNQVYYREAGDGDEFAWHQDICFRTPPQDYLNIEENYLQTVIVVDDILPGMGAIEFIPGSHKLGDLNLVPRDNSEKGLRKFVRNLWQGDKAYAQAGDILLWGPMVVHGSEQNVSDKNRMTYMNGFATQDSVLNKKIFPVYEV